MEKAHKYISQSFSGAKDDTILVCYICQLNFTSLYNKQSHYSGKLHLQTLLQHIDQLVKKSENRSNDGCSKTAVATPLEVVASDCQSESI